jgi:prepilin peptidase CpaA
MNFVPLLSAVLISLLLIAAAFSDVATRIIPDTVVIAVALSGAAGRLYISPSGLFVSILVAAVCFAMLAFLHGRGMLGGGDVKLASAVCLGLSAPAAYRFVFVTAMAGGVLALLHLAARRALRGSRKCGPPPRGASLFRRVFCAERWRISRHGSLSYGVAIACGGICAVLEGQGNQ